MFCAVVTMVTWHVISRHSPRWKKVSFCTSRALKNMTLLLLWLAVLRVASGSVCDAIYSIYGYELRGHTITQSQAAGMFDCMSRCQNEFYCLAITFRMTDQMCALKSGNRFIQGSDFGMSDPYLYMENPEPYRRQTFKTCAELKAAHASAPSGYYRMTHSPDRRLIVYCDMDSFGGGWNLVATISSTDNNHLLTSQHNCLNGMLCVQYIASGTIPSRKLSDQDIHKLAATEGVFRVDLNGQYTVFYKIPSGENNFDSSCRGGTSCPRIIVSYSHPYVWESNCKGIAIGYQIATYNGCHRVFDGHDSAECGSSWHSSGYTAKRAMYGYPCEVLHPSHSSLGLYKNKQGMLWVK